MNPTLLLSTLLLTWLLAPPTVAPQARADQAQRPEFKSGVDLVAVDVVVVDSNGRPIADLTPGDFTVTVDGKARRVVSADFVAHRVNRGETAPAGITAAPPTALNTLQATGRLITIVADLDHITAGLGRNAMSAAGRFLDRLNPEDRVAVLTIPTGGPKVDFTTDRQRVRDALDRIVGRATPVAGEFRIGIAEAIDMEMRDAITTAEVVGRECERSLYGADCPRLVTRQAANMVREEQQATRAALDVLSAFAGALGTAEGPKTVVLLTEGLVLTRDTRTYFKQFAEAAAAASLNIYVVSLDTLVRPVIDASSNTGAAAASRDVVVRLEGLNELAGMTRGALFRMSGAGDTLFDRIAAELSGYYLLGFEALASDRDGKSHQIRVTSTRGADVRARAEFVVPIPEAAGTEPLDARARLTRLLRLPGVVADLPLRLAAYPVRDADPEKVKILVAAEVGGTPVPAPLDADIGFEIVTADGRIVADSLDRATLASDGEDRAPLYLTAAAVEPGTYTLKLAALVATGANGTVELPLDARLRLVDDVLIGDVMLGTAPGGRFQPSPGAGENGAELAAFMEVCASSADRLEGISVDFEVAPDVIDAPALARAMADVGSTADPTRIVAQGAIDLDALRLAPGTYVVRAIVFEGDRELGRSARRFVRR